ncbi:MAG TPA: nuclear transport factor 2 family protein [Pyrinomonadaceae bacterium]|jgi:glutaredoxin
MPDALSPKQKAARLANLEEHLDAENAHDLARIMKTYGQNPVVVINGNTFNHLQAIHAFHEKFGFGQHGSFTNLRVQEKQRYICDDAIILEAILSGKQMAAWQGIASTGRDFEIPVCTVYTFDEDGKLAGERVYFDSALLISQLRS